MQLEEKKNSEIVILLCRRYKLSSLVRKISWTNNLLIFLRCKTIEEMEFYLKLIKHEKKGSIKAITQN